VFVLRLRSTTTHEVRQVVLTGELRPDHLHLFLEGAGSCDCVRRAMFKLAGGERRYEDGAEGPCGENVAYVCSAILDGDLSYVYDENRVTPHLWMDPVGNPIGYTRTEPVRPGGVN
jgi:hypothetical protein